MKALLSVISLINIIVIISLIICIINDSAFCFATKVKRKIVDFGKMLLLDLR